jgi:hypothetical protein
MARPMRDDTSAGHGTACSGGASATTCGLEMQRRDAAATQFDAGNVGQWVQLVRLEHNLTPAPNERGAEADGCGW